MTNYRSIVARFGETMVEKLEQNAQKGGPEVWRTFAYIRLGELLQDEFEELGHAIGGALTPDEVDREAADVANFALMIADKYRSQYNK